MRIILVRHGETNWNNEDRFRGHIDVGLNPGGLAQARMVGEALRDIELDGIYSSPLSRALVTAEEIAHPRSLQVSILEAFKDFHFGAWQGLTRDEVRYRYPDVYAQWESAPHMVRIPEGETLDEVEDRVYKGLSGLVREGGDGTIVIVSHGLVNKVLLCRLLGMGTKGFWRVKQDNGAVNLFEFNGRGVKVFVMNSTFHIRSLAGVVEDMRSPLNPLG